MKSNSTPTFVRVWFQSQLNSVLVLKTGKACVYGSMCISQALKTCRWFSTPVSQKIKSLEIKHSIEVVCPIIFVRVQFQLIIELNWAESMDWVWFKIQTIGFDIQYTLYSAVYIVSNYVYYSLSHVFVNCHCCISQWQCKIVCLTVLFDF